MKESLSKYYRFPLFGGLEALHVTGHNSSFPHHYHDTYNVSLIFDGIFPAQLQNKLITAPAGSILITNPQEIHANPCEKKSPVSFFTFYLSQEFVTFCNSGRAVLFNSNVIDDTDLFRKLHKLSKSISDHRILQYEDEFRQTIQELAQRHGSDRALGEHIRVTRLFEELLAAENLTKFSLQEAALRFGMDKFKFLRLFKYQTGLTPNNYFILKRIEKSKILLTEGHDLLTIAINLGFYDAAHFCNHFRKFTGVSPGAYTQSD
jgi:AraC-like DNA-binding protein